MDGGIFGDNRPGLRPRADASKEGLRVAAKLAIATYPGELERAREYFIETVLREPDLVRALFKPWFRAATGDYLSAAARECAAEKRGEGHPKLAEKASSVMLSPHPIPAQKEQPLPPLAAQKAQCVSPEAMASVRQAEARNLLRSFVVNGRPIGMVTTREARAWSVSHRRDARFVELLVSGLPDDGVIGSFHTAAEAERLYAQAEREANNV